MFVEHQIDELIQTGWRVLDSDFNETEFYRWRRQALQCLTALLGADHDDTRYFREHLRTEEKLGDFETRSPETFETERDKPQRLVYLSGGQCGGGTDVRRSLDDR